MRNQEALKKSYEKQKSLFDQAKEKRLANKQNRIDQITKKIDKLQTELASAKQQLQEELEREFPPFSDFSERAAQQSNKSRT